MFNTLYDYCNEWKIEFNVKKTKITTKITQLRTLSYQYYHIDIISEFNYLGVLMSSNGKLLKPRNILLIREEKHFFFKF